MKKKLLTLLLIATMMTSLTVGCGNGQTETNGTNSSEWSVSSSEATSTEASKEEKSSAPIESKEEKESESKETTNNQPVSNAQSNTVTSNSGSNNATGNNVSENNNVGNPTPQAQEQTPEPQPQTPTPQPQNNTPTPDVDYEVEHYHPSETMPSAEVIERNAKGGNKMALIDGKYFFIDQNETEESLTRWKYILNGAEVDAITIKDAELNSGIPSYVARTDYKVGQGGLLFYLTRTVVLNTN